MYTPTTNSVIQNFLWTTHAAATSVEFLLYPLPSPYRTFHNPFETCILVTETKRVVMDIGRQIRLIANRANCTLSFFLL